MDRRSATSRVVPAAEAAPRMSSEERREQIIVAALAVFGAKGYVGTTTDDVAKAAAVSQPYVVRLFGTKENLFLAALGSALDRLLEGFRAAPYSDDPAVYGESMGEAYMDLLHVRGLHQTLSHAFLLGAHPVIGPAARQGFAEVWQFLRDAGFSAGDAEHFLAKGMLINTMIGLRMTEEYGQDGAVTELLDACFPANIKLVLAQAPRTDEPW